MMYDGVHTKSTKKNLDTSENNNCLIYVSFETIHEPVYVLKPNFLFVTLKTSTYLTLKWDMIFYCVF